jgi:membrane associated rhomboid family serine protease
MSDLKVLKIDLIRSVLFIIPFWIVFIITWFYDIELVTSGVYPRHIKGVTGIFTSVFIHSGWQHIIANTTSFFTLSFFLFHFYKKIAYQSLLFNYVVGGVILWIIGREYWHIGVSGVVYGMAFQICFLGIFSKRIALSAVSLVVIFLYGSFVWGLMPINTAISWEGHLSGALTGLALAIMFRKRYRVVKKYDLDTRDDEHYIEYSYKLKKPTVFDLLKDLPDSYYERVKKKKKSR